MSRKTTQLQRWKGNCYKVTIVNWWLIRLNDGWKVSKASLDEVIMTIYRPAQQNNISMVKIAVKFLHPGTP